MHSPYAPPAYGNDPYRVRTEVNGAPIAKSLRIGFLVATIVGIVGFFAAVGTWSAAMIMMTTSSSPYARPNEALLTTGIVAFVVCILAVYAGMFTGMGWVYRVWSWLPESERHTKHWKGAITPSTAALFLLIPYFQYYWMFVINCAICDAMDRLRVARPTSLVAPKTLAIMAGIFQLTIPIPVGVLCWYFFMRRVERMSEEMAATPMPAMPHG